MMKQLLMVALLSIGVTAFAADENSLQALEGNDPVTYFTKGEPTRGDGFILSKYQGQTYLFVNKANKATFDKDPSKYAPQFGGWCAFGASVGKKFHADPKAFVIHEGKLYVNVNQDILKKFKGDLAGNIKKAEANWVKIQDKDESSL